MSRRPGPYSVPPTIRLPEVHLARDHREATIRSHLRSGIWEKVARGAYVSIGEGEPPYTRRRRFALARIVALTERRRADQWISHTSAVPLTALMIADAALSKYIDRAQIDEVLEAISGRPGSARARELLVLADAGAESPGETRLRMAVLLGGLPAPETQIKIVTHMGTFWADAGWDRSKLLLEYDGRVKYEDQQAEAFMQEKRRHDAIVEAGYIILRVTKEDLESPSALAGRIKHRRPRADTTGKPPGVLNTDPAGP